MSTNENALYLGLFGVLSNGSTVFNLHVDGNIDTPFNGAQRWRVGLLAGEVYSSAIYNVHTSGLVWAQASVGGLVGSIAQSLVHTCSYLLLPSLTIKTGTLAV